MKFGKTKSGKVIEAGPKWQAFCPSCDEPLVAKCGDIRVWHWSHKSSVDCDTWSEGETQWHLWWKSLIPNPSENTEVVLTYNGKSHRADAISETSQVIEFQHSPLALPEMEERERFYRAATCRNVQWVFDVAPFLNNFKMYHSMENKSGNLYHDAVPFDWPDGAEWVARWKYSRGHLIDRMNRVLLDTQDLIFGILQIQGTKTVKAEIQSPFDRSNPDAVIDQKQVWIWGKRWSSHELISLWY